MKIFKTTLAALLALSFAVVASAHVAQATNLTCTTIVDMKNVPNVLYKNQNVHGSRGRTLLDQGHRFGGRSRLYVSGLNKKIVSCFGLYKCDSPFGCRYYQAMCRDSLSNASFIRHVKAGGSKTALVGRLGGGTCYSFDSSTSRYGNVRK